MKIVILISCILIISCNPTSQKSSTDKDSYYDVIQLGEFNVGFCDSVIYNSKIRFDFLSDTSVSYSQYDYSGSTPLFLQIWYPLEQAGSDRPMKLRDFRKRNLAFDLRSVYDPLCAKMDSFFVRYNIIEDFANYDSIDYGDHSYFDVLDTLMGYNTKSNYKRILNRLNFPVIVYHHGGQGLSDENFILSEYFSSRGYIVVSSNFHLPFKNRIYGYEGMDFDDTELPKSVITFAKTLTTDSKLYFIGHSAGAQVGFKFLHQENWVDAFISLETTLEGREVEYLKSEDGWPELSNIIETHKADYSIPILMVANTMEQKSFPLFNQFPNTTMIQVSQKEFFGHESYTSGYILRYLYRDMFAQPDTIELKKQLRLYNKQLKLYDAFLTSVANEEQLNTKEFEEDFFLSKFNY